MNPISINITAVLIAAVVNFIYSALWFNVLFSKPWLAGIGKTAEQVAADFKPYRLGIAAALALITALALAVIMDWAGVSGAVNGALLGFVGALAFAIPQYIVKDTFEVRPVSITWVNAAHDLVLFPILGAILGAIA